MGSHFRGHLKITANSASTEDKQEKWTGMLQLVEKGEETDAAKQKSSGEERANSPSHVQGIGSQRACHPNSSWISFGRLYVSKNVCFSSSLPSLLKYKYSYYPIIIPFTSVKWEVISLLQFPILVVFSLFFLSIYCRLLYLFLLTSVSLN